MQKHTDQLHADIRRNFGAPLGLIVFDWDGTLMDSTGAIVYAIREAARDTGLAVPTEERAAHVIGLGLSDALRLAVPDLARDDVPAFTERYRYHFVSRNAQLHPFAGVNDMLRALAGGPVPLAVATGKSRAGLNAALLETDWQAHFLTTRCADEGDPKPHPWMLNDICEELGVAVEHTVMIGDTTHDLGMARAAGAHGIAVTYGAHAPDKLQTEPALATVHDVPELHALLSALLSADQS